MDFSPLSDLDIKSMLETIGVSDIDDLFQDIPEDIRNSPLDISKGLSEYETFTHLNYLSRKNHTFSSFFCGAGIYNHYIPPVVNELIHRSEFYTAYTPYQAEISQGFLQAIFEYQTSICNLTAMDATNASVYDGATAATESLIMAKNITRKNTFVILQPINPEYHKVIDQYGSATGYTAIYSSIENLMETIRNNDIGAVLIQNPNYFGELLDIKKIIDDIKQEFPKIIIIYLSIETSSLGLLKRPGTLGVDIVCGECQSIGLPMNFGGPTMGFITTTKKNMRKLPGRIVGRTKELNGDKMGYILTLQAREQHIRREKAQSNICSNEALCMLSVQIYLAAMGYDGLKKVAINNVKNINYLRNQLKKLKGLTIINSEKPIYNEFLIELPTGSSNKILELCTKDNICPPRLLDRNDLKLLSMGIELLFNPKKEYLLLCSTETNSKEDIDKFITIIKEVVV